MLLFETMHNVRYFLTDPHVLLLQSSENEVLLRQMLYDVVILVDYTNLKPQMWTQLPGDCMEKIALTWLLVVDAAVQFARYGKMIVAEMQSLH